MKKIFWTSLKKYFEYFWENIFKVFEKYFKNYSVTPGPFFWEFVTESVNMKVKQDQKSIDATEVSGHVD